MTGNARASHPVFLFLYDHPHRVSPRRAAHVRIAAELGFRTLLADWRQVRVSPSGTVIARAREVIRHRGVEQLHEPITVDPAIVMHRMLVGGAAVRLMRRLAAAHPRAVMSYAPPWRRISRKWLAELYFRAGERDGIQVARPNTYLVRADEVAKVVPRLLSGTAVIFKPSAGSQCAGIRLATSNTLANVAAALPRGHLGPYVAQELVTDPLLYNGKKFDVRLYAIVTSFAPLRYRVYRGGIARVAARPFIGAEADDSLAALTGNCYRRRQRQRLENLSVASLLAYLRQAGYQVDDFWDRIDTLMGNVFACLGRAPGCGTLRGANRHFYLAGFDVLLTCRGGIVQPLFLETNYVPQLNGWGRAADRALEAVHRDWLADLRQACA